MSKLNISNRGKTVPESPIRKLIPYSDDAKRRGIKVYHLNIGQPDIPTPEPMMNVFKNTDIKVVAYGPSGGIYEYVDNLAKYYQRNGIDAKKEDIIVTTGGSEAIIFTLMAVMDTGDEVIIPEPFYTNYNGFAVMAGVKIVPLTTKPETGFALPPKKEIVKKITSKTKALMINNPGNPTGVVYTKEEMEVLREIVLEHNLFLLSDEVYREFTFDGSKHISIFHLKDIEDRAVIMDSISKRYSACGARVGAIVSKNKEIISSVLKFGQARLCPPTMEQLAANAALKLGDEFFDEMIGEYQNRRDVVFEELMKIDGVVCDKPKGAFYCVPKLPVDDTEKFCVFMLKDFNLNGETVMVSPAAGFYATSGLGKNEIRIAYVLNCKDLKKAMKILRKGIEEYNKRN